MTQSKDFSKTKAITYLLIAFSSVHLLANRGNSSAKIVSAPTPVVVENTVVTRKKKARQSYQKEMQGCMSIRELDADSSNSCRVKANMDAYKKGLIDHNTLKASNALDVANYPKRSYGLPTAATEIYFATEGKESSKLFWGKE